MFIGFDLFEIDLLYNEKYVCPLRVKLREEQKEERVNNLHWHYRHVERLRESANIQVPHINTGSHLFMGRSEDILLLHRW